MMPRSIVVLACVLVALGPQCSWAQDDRVTIEPRERWTNLAAESMVDYHFTIRSPRALKGRVSWTFAHADTKRVFVRGRGEAPLALPAGAAAQVRIPLEVPPLNPGIVLQAQLIVTVHQDGKKEPEPGFERTLWLFSPDPFAGRSKWVEGLKITLYNTDAKSKTAEVLKAMKIPFEETRNPASLSERKDALVLIGEGVSFRDDRGLAEAIFQAAARGVPVVCLAPKDGALALPGFDSPLPAPASLSLHRQDIIARLDRRLDALGWPPQNQVVARSLAIRAEEGRVVAEVQEGAKGWAWLQLDYPDKKGRLILCGFPIMEGWDAGPTPRYLFARLLEHATELSTNESTK